MGSVGLFTSHLSAQLCSVAPGKDLVTPQLMVRCTEGEAGSKPPSQKPAWFVWMLREDLVSAACVNAPLPCLSLRSPSCNHSYFPCRQLLSLTGCQVL